MALGYLVEKDAYGSYWVLMMFEVTGVRLELMNLYHLVKSVFDFSRILLSYVIVSIDPTSSKIAIVVQTP